MKKLMLAVFLFTAPVLSAQTNVIPVYFCAQNATQASVSGLKSTNYQMGVVPYCTVTVYLTQTQNLATTTPQTPLTANYDGSIPPIYASNSQGYDVVLSGGVYPNTYIVPVTFTDVFSGGGGGTGSGITQLTGDVTAGPGTGSQAATLKTVNSSPGSCGDGADVCAITIDLKGRVLSQTAVPITTGTNNTGTAGQFAIYASNGNTLSGISQTAAWSSVYAGAAVTANCFLMRDLAGVFTCAATSSSAALTYLGAQPALGYTPAHSGANSDITSLLGLTTPLSIGQGGTGCTTGSCALTAFLAASSTSQNYVLAGPTSGSGAPTFRLLVSGDIPNNAANTTGNAATATNFTGSLAGDVTGTQGATSVVKVNGAAVPASKQVVGTNSSGQFTDATSWVENLLGVSLYPGYQALYIPYLDGSGTTLHDQSANAYNCTFASGGNAPNWSAAANSIVFLPTNSITGGQWLTCPAAALTGAGTIQMWYRQTMPYSIDGLSHSIPKQWALGDSSGNGIGWYQTYFGAPTMIGNPTLYNYDLIPTDRLIGNSSFSVVCNGASPATAYVNGHSPTSYLYGAGTSTLVPCPTWASTGNVEIGGTSYFNGVGNSSPQWELYAIVIYPTSVTITPAIILQNETYMRTVLTQHGVTTFGIESRPPYFLAYQGDSRMANAVGSPPSGGNWQLTTSREWQISQLEPDRDQYFNLGMYNQRLCTQVTNMPLEITPLCTQSISVAKTVTLDSGTNDIQGGITGAATYTCLQNYATNLKAACTGTKIIFDTSIARGTFSSTQEGYRETYNSDALSGWAAATLNVDAVNDNANDPIAATQVTPNVYNPSAASSCNATWFDSDCVHFTAALNAELAPAESAAMKLAQGRLNTCTIVQKQIPYQVLVAANTASPSLSQTIPLGIQLKKGENVCSLSENVTSAFTGPTTLTMSVGNSGGSTTSYQSAFSLMATGDTTASPTYVATGGAVNVTFTATGANLSTVTGGNLVVNIGLINNGLY